RSHRSAGSMQCMSLSRTFKPCFAMPGPPPFCVGARYAEASQRGLLGSKPPSALVEAEQRGCVLCRDLAPAFLGNPPEDTIEEFARPRPRRFGVRKIVAPQHVLYTDDVTKPEPVVVLHELHEHVAKPVLAREQAVS